MTTDNVLRKRKVDGGLDAWWSMGQIGALIINPRLAVVGGQVLAGLDELAPSDWFNWASPRINNPRDSPNLGSTCKKQGPIIN